MATSTLASPRPPLYRDTRVIGIVLQALFAAGLVLFAWFLYRNMTANLAVINKATGGALSWNYLGQTAGFEISEGPAFRPEESYWRAYLVGIANTLRVSLAGIILATLLGGLIGIARVSNNWLISRIALVYVEVFRNTPLLVQLLFWYFGVIAALPDVKDAAAVPGLAYLSNRGIYITWPFLSPSGTPWLGWVVGGVVAGVIVAWLRRRQLERQGLPASGFVAGVLTFFVVAIAGFFVAFSTNHLPANTAYELQARRPRHALRRRRRGRQVHAGRRPGAGVRAHHPARRRRDSRWAPSSPTATASFASSTCRPKGPASPGRSRRRWW